jgi:hypothetical protein
VRVETNDLADSAEAAQIIGLASPNSVSTYRQRYEDFPVPVIEKGRCVLWLRADIVRWSAGHERQRGPKPGTPKR